VDNRTQSPGRETRGQLGSVVLSYILREYWVRDAEGGVSRAGRVGCLHNRGGKKRKKREGEKKRRIRSHAPGNFVGGSRVRLRGGRGVANLPYSDSVGIFF